MIKGYDNDLKQFVFAEDVDKSAKHSFICPCCKDSLIVKQGEILMHHFSHYRENEVNKNCILKTTVSNYDEWIYQMLTGFHPSEVEVDINDQVFDILLDNKTSVTLCYIEHLMKDKGKIDVLELAFKQRKLVNKWTVLLNMSDEFELIEEGNKLVWKDRASIKYSVLTKDLIDLDLWVYYNDIFYEVLKIENNKCFMDKMEFGNKVVGVERFREILGGK